MALYIEDIEVDRLAAEVAARHRISKTEAVRRALLHELARGGVAGSLVERGMAFTDALLARAGPQAGLPANKTYVDGLYE